MKIAFAFLFSLVMVFPAFAASKGVVLLDTSFDDANLAGWRSSGDLCVAPQFCAGQPGGIYWVALSTNDDSDVRTMCGGSSVKGMQSVLRSPELALPFKPSRIRVEFRVKFLTNENINSDLGNDQFTARLLTRSGPVTIVAIDDSGPSPESSNLNIEGSTDFYDSNCNPDWKYETDFLKVTYFRRFREPVITKMNSGPVAIEFSLDNYFDSDFDSAAVIDDVQIKVYQ